MYVGRAVQGAIGSQRKIDPTYVSEAVERAEFLESSTKKYGVKLLMSESFHRLLHTGNRRRCRKVDQIVMREDDEGDEDDLTLNGEILELFTFDVSALLHCDPILIVAYASDGYRCAFGEERCDWTRSV